MSTKIKFLRTSLALFAILGAAAHIFPSPSGSTFGQFWFYLEVVVYTIFALAFLLGLKRWYLLAAGFSALNLALFVTAGLIAMPPITSAPLSANLTPFNYDISRLFSVLSYIYIIVVGTILFYVDSGSKLEKLY